jgi:hypothetical protein
MKKKTVKKLVLSKETVSLITATVVGGALTDLCGTFRCPTDPNICQSGQWPC